MKRWEWEWIFGWVIKSNRSLREVVGGVGGRRIDFICCSKLLCGSYLGGFKLICLY